MHFSIRNHINIFENGLENFYASKFSFLDGKLPIGRHMQCTGRPVERKTIYMSTPTIIGRPIEEFFSTTDRHIRCIGRHPCCSIKGYILCLMCCLYRSTHSMYRLTHDLYMSTYISKFLKHCICFYSFCIPFASKMFTYKYFIHASLSSKVSSE